MYFKNFFKNLIIYPITLIVLVKAWKKHELLKWYVNQFIITKIIIIEILKQFIE